MITIEAPGRHRCISLIRGHTPEHIERQRSALWRHARGRGMTVIDELVMCAHADETAVVNQIYALLARHAHRGDFGTLLIYDVSRLSRTIEVGVWLVDLIRMSGLTLHVVSNGIAKLAD